MGNSRMCTVISRWQIQASGEPGRRGDDGGRDQVHRRPPEAHVQGTEAEQGRLQGALLYRTVSCSMALNLYTTCVTTAALFGCATSSQRVVIKLSMSPWSSWYVWRSALCLQAASTVPNARTPSSRACI